MISAVWSLALCLVALFLSCLGSCQAIRHPGEPKREQAYGNWSTGVATYYGGSDGGNCGYGAFPQNAYGNNLAAVNFYDGGAACGGCYRLRCSGSNQCTGSTVDIMVMDNCPCGGGMHFDLYPGAFATVANPIAGIIDIQFQQIPCQMTGNMQFTVDPGSNPFWLRVLVSNVAGFGALSKVEFHDAKSSSFAAMSRNDGAKWVMASGGPFTAPYSFRVTSGDNDATVVADSVVPDGFSMGQAYASSVQF